MWDLFKIIPWSSWSSYGIADAVLLIILCTPTVFNRFGISSLLYYIISCAAAGAMGYFLGAPLLVGVVKCAIPKINNVSIILIAVVIVVACVACVASPTKNKDLYFLDALMGRIWIAFMTFIFSIGVMSAGLYVWKSPDFQTQKGRVLYFTQMVLSEQQIASINDILYKATKTKIVDDKLESTLFFNMLVFANRITTRTSKYCSKNDPLEVAYVSAINYLTYTSDAICKACSAIHKDAVSEATLRAGKK